MKVALGLSGGVDSAVAALLLREQGHDVVGVTMTLGRADEAAQVAAARRVARRLKMPIKVIDCADIWRDNVLKYIRETYLAGETPNPCVRCNAKVKLGLLPALAFGLGCERFATGHYARTAGDARRPKLLRGVDRQKDQSYFLYRVVPDILGYTLFPLGELTKAQVRQKAREAGLDVADRGDSQDFCGGDPMAIVAAPPREGNVVTTAGKVIGRHAGYWNFTVGKRKGLGIGGGTPYYVVALRAATNEVVVGTKAETAIRAFRLRDVVGRPTEGELLVKVRSAGEPKGPVVWDGTRVACPEGLSGVAPGQSAVFYNGDEVVGGGIIDTERI